MPCSGPRRPRRLPPGAPHPPAHRLRPRQRCERPGSPWRPPAGAFGFCRRLSRELGREAMVLFLVLGFGFGLGFCGRWAVPDPVFIGDYNTRSVYYLVSRTGGWGCGRLPWAPTWVKPEASRGGPGPKGAVGFGVGPRSGLTACRGCRRRREKKKGPPGPGVTGSGPNRKGATLVMGGVYRRPAGGCTRRGPRVHRH